MPAEHKIACRSIKSVQLVSKQKPNLETTQRYPKTDMRYWQQAVFFPTYKRGGVTRHSGEYAAKIQHAGKRELFPLGTSNKTVAAAKAKEIYTLLKGLGWEPTLAKFKPNVSKAVVTVGEFLAEVKAKASGRTKTVDDYCRAFRTIVASIAGIDGGKEKFDYRNGGRAKWLEKVHAIKLASIEPAKVQAWKIAFLKRAGSSPVQQRTARISVNSLIRQAKSLFAPGMMKFIQLDLPTALPFEGVKFEPRQSMRYRSSFKIEDVIRLALNGDEKEKIAPLPDEQKKIFLLAIMAGLRRNEIDKLEWSAFCWKDEVIRIEATRYLRPKTEDSTGDVEVDAELIAMFRGFHAKARSEFVIESAVKPRPDAAYSHYRCQRDFEALTKWLRANGVTGARPLHTLRKEYGSQMCAKHGIYAASHALRHGDITITSQHYLDSRKRVTLKFGDFISPNLDVIPFDPAGENQEREGKMRMRRLSIASGRKKS